MSQSRPIPRNEAEYRALERRYLLRLRRELLQRLEERPVAASTLRGQIAACDAQLARVARGATAA